MSAYSADKKTLAYQLGEALSEMTDHYLLMTATPHKGDPENFCLFLELLDRDVYGDVKSLEEAMRRNEAPFYLRRTKEALVTFPDPETGEVKKLFTKRDVQTVAVRDRRRRVGLLRRADPLRRGPVDQGAAADDSARGRALGFTMAMLQRRFASSIYAVRRSLERMRDKRREDPRRSRRLPPGADRQEAARRLRRSDRRRAAGDHRRDWKRWSPRSIRPPCARRSSSSTSSSTRPERSKQREVESKLVKLREVLTEQGIFDDPKMKLLVFTEHKDTLDYLVRRQDGRWKLAVGL